jgi:hypothetical protein
MGGRKEKTGRRSAMAESWFALREVHSFADYVLKKRWAKLIKQKRGMG